MNYLERLRSLERTKGPTAGPDKTDKGASVSSVRPHGAAVPRQVPAIRPPEVEHRAATHAVIPVPLDARAIEERAAIVSEFCPAPCVERFARLNHQKPVAVSDAQWSRALDGAGRFFDDWGANASAMRRSASDLFDVPRDDLEGRTMKNGSAARRSSALRARQHRAQRREGALLVRLNIAAWHSLVDRCKKDNASPHVLEPRCRPCAERLAMRG
jgi:hypothetical protein